MTQAPASGAALAQSWPMFRGEPSHAGDCTGCASPKWLEVWRVELGERVDASVVIDSVGRAYVATRKGLVSVLDSASGTHLGQRRLDAGVWSTPAILRDQLLVLTSAGTLYALHTGSLEFIWRRDGFANTSSAITVANGLVYFCNGRSLVVLDDKGADVRRLPLQGTCFSAPAVTGDGTALVGDRSGTVYAFRQGRLSWRGKTSGYVDGSPAIAGGRVFVGSNDRAVHAFDLASGAALWKRPRQGWVVSTPAVRETMLFVGDDSGTLSALATADGSELWTRKVGDDLASSPTLIGDEVVHAAHDGKLYANSLDGRQRREPIVIGSAIFASIAVAPSGVIVVASHAGAVVGVR